MDWDEERAPLPDEANDALRRARYWDWSGARTFADPAPPLAHIAADVTWHLVDNQDQADFEAKHMRHSVGYNFDHYAKMGDIYSLREGGIPIVTALVANGAMVHAVRPCNGRIEDSDHAILSRICAERGWRILDADALQGARDAEEDPKPSP